MKRIIIVIAGALAGCATSSILQKQPVMSLSSSRSADHLEECIALVLPGTVNTIRGEGRRTITAGGDGLTIAAVTITGGSPATVELRQGTPVSGAIRDKIRRCAE
jgi:hypothetical protein